MRLRLRPILMTAASTIVGFSPLIFEMAVGLERMSPLGIAAGAGLLIGTVVTTVVTPVIFSLFESLRRVLLSGFRGVTAAAGLRSAVILIAAVGLLAAPAHASEAGDTPVSPLTLRDAVAHALSHSPDLETARAEVARLSGAVQTARSAGRPRLDFSAGATLSEEEHGMIPLAASAVQRFDDRLYAVGVDARYLAFDFGRTGDEVRAALERREGGRDVLRRRREETVFEVSRLFLSVLGVRDVLASAEASRASLSSLLTITERLADSGRAATIDALKVRVRLARVESDIADLEARRRTLRAALSAALGLDEGEPLPELAYASPRVGGAEDLDRPDGGDGTRSDVAAAERRLAAAEATLASARKGWFPRVDVLASYARYGADDPAAAIPGGPDDPWADDARVGVSLTLPLFDGGLRRGRIRQAAAGRENAAALLRGERLAARREVEEALASFAGARARIEASENAVSEAAEALRIERLKYRAGRGIINDVLDAEAAKLAADGLWREASRQAEIARLSLALALGELPDGVAGR